MMALGVAIISLIVAIISLAFRLIERRPWPQLGTVRNVLRDMRLDALIERQPKRHAYDAPQRPLTIVRGSADGYQPSACGFTVHDVEAHPPTGGTGAVPLSTPVERGARSCGRGEVHATSAGEPPALPGGQR